MVSNKARWGTSFCITALVLLGGLTYLFHAVPAARNPVLYQKILPAIGLLFFCLALFFGHFSYTRLHSIRVYFLGYGACCIGIVYFTLCNASYPAAFFPPLPHGYREIVVCASLINLIAVALIPPGTKFRVIKSLTLSIVTIQVILLCILRFGPGASPWLRPFFFSSPADTVFWTGPALVTAALLLSFWKIRCEFFLGGVIAGGGLLLLAAWCSRVTAPVHADAFQTLVFAGTAVYLLGSMVLHGFLRMEHRIAYDPLLKIYNRDYCSKIITEQADLNVAPPFGVAMIDIDRFKEVNDTYGHQAGDAVLHAVAQAVQRGTDPDGIVCRYGGEELVVFFPQKNTAEVIETVEGIRKKIDGAKTPFGKKTIQVTISVGVSCREQYSQPIVDVIQAADKALYAAKGDGRNRVKSQKTPIKN
jgi:diguanylate cyclase (GGDEF)-like protein